MKFGQRILDFVSYAYFGFDLSFCAFFEVKSSLFNTLEQNHDHYEMKLWCFKKIVSFHCCILCACSDGDFQSFLILFVEFLNLTNTH